MRLPRHFTPTILRNIERIAQACPDEREGGGWCCESTDYVAQYLGSIGLGYFVDWTGTEFDESHAFLRVPGFIIDPSITMFAARSHGFRPSKEQMCTVANFPHHPAAPTVAVIPESHPLYKLYGGGGGRGSYILDAAVEDGTLGPELLPYKVEQWLPKKLYTRPTRPHRMYTEFFAQIGLPAGKRSLRPSKGRKRK